MSSSSRKNIGSLFIVTILPYFFIFGSIPFFPSDNLKRNELTNINEVLQTKEYDIRDSEVLFSYNDYGCRGIEYYDNKIYFADYRNNSIFVFDQSGNLLQDNITLSNPPSFFPHGLDIYNNTIWTTDYSGDKIYTFDFAGNPLANFSATDGPSTNGISGIEVDDNYIWLTRNQASYILKHDHNGTYLESISIPITEPASISLLEGDFYMSDQSNSSYIFKVSQTGQLLEGYNTSYTINEISAVQEGNQITIITTNFQNPPYLIVKHTFLEPEVLFNYGSNGCRGIEYYDDKIYIADHVNQTIFVFDQTGNLLQDNITLSTPPTHFPHGLDISNGIIYTTDYLGDKIYSFDLAGNPLTNFSAIGGPSANGITGIEVDESNIWLTRYNSQYILKHALDGAYLGTINIPLVKPTGISLLGGNFFMTDDDNISYIFKISKTGLLLESYNTSYTIDEISAVYENSQITVITCDFQTPLYSVVKHSLPSEDVLFEYGYSTCRGIEFYNNLIYVADNVNHTIWIYNKAGVLQDNFTISNPPTQFPHGLDIHNDTIWTTDYTGNKIYAFSLTGTPLSNFSATGGSVSGITGLEIENDYIWLIRYDSNNIYKHTSTGSYLESIAIPLTSPDGISLLGDTFFMSDQTNNSYIFKVSKSGDLLESFNTSYTINEISAVQEGNQITFITANFQVSPYLIVEHIYSQDILSEVAFVEIIIWLFVTYTTILCFLWKRKEI